MRGQQGGAGGQATRVGEAASARRYRQEERCEQERTWWGQERCEDGWWCEQAHLRYADAKKCVSVPRLQEGRLGTARRQVHAKREREKERAESARARESASRSPLRGIRVICQRFPGLYSRKFCESLAEDVSHPLARTADRLVTVTALWVFFQSASVYTFEKRDWLLVICQLWGATCTDPGTVFWGYSYSVYLWVLLPLLAWFGGSQVVVCGKLFVRETNNENMLRADYEYQYHIDSADYVSIHDRRVDGSAIDRYFFCACTSILARSQCFPLFR